jgi:hypothetical protein
MSSKANALRLKSSDAECIAAWRGAEGASVGFVIGGS